MSQRKRIRGWREEQDREGGPGQSALEPGESPGVVGSDSSGNDTFPCPLPAPPVHLSEGCLNEEIGSNHLLLGMTTATGVAQID